MESDASLTPPPVRPAQLTPGHPLETLHGVALEPGERVVVYAAANHKTAKVIHIVIGVLLAPVLVGIAIIVYGVMYDRWHLRFVAITSKRVIMQKGNEPARWLAREEIVDVRSRRESGGGGGIYGAAATVGQAAENLVAQKKDKTDARYWVNTEAVIVQGKKGALTIGGGVNAAAIGRSVARLVSEDGWADALPTANHPA
jgi:hypothetical protein